MKEYKPRTWLRIVTVIGVLVLLFGGTLGIRSYYEYIQYMEIGYQYGQIYMTNFFARLIFLLLSFAVIFALLAVNAFVLREAVHRDNEDLKIIKNKWMMVLFVLPIAVIVGFVISGRLYESFLTFRNVTWFGETDPVFGWDLGYYIFTRPFYMALTDAAKGILLFTILATLLIYVLLQLRGGVGELKNLFKNRGVFIHCFINLMLFVVLTALAYKFDIEELLYGSFCSVTGAGATDMNVWYLYYKIAPFLLIIIVPVSIYFLTKARFKRAAATLASFPAVWILAVLCAVIHQTVFVDSNELTRENKYLSYNIAMTRKAYELDRFRESIYEVRNNLTYKDFNTYGDALEQANIASEEQMLQNILAQQPTGDYEKFTDIDIGVCTADGQKVPVAVAARELDSDALTKSADAYINTSFKYTHSTGLVMAQMNAFDARGNLTLRIKDVPPISDFGMTQVSEPRIYYGEQTDETAFVRTAYTEMDYKNHENSGGYVYSGFGGIQMTPFNRFAMAFGGGDFKQLFSGHINRDSRALVNRNIIRRISKIAPFFMYDADPYLVMTDGGQLKWVIDAYAVTDKYPYATSIGNINYIRPGAKVVVDAYQGTVVFYPVDWENPFVQTYAKMYPTLFSKEDIPEDIKRNIRYPQDLFRIQTDIYRQYHVTDTGAFYNATEEWETAKTKTEMTPYYTMTKADGTMRMQLMTAFTQNQSNTLCAFVLADTEADPYGTVHAFYLTESEDNKAYGLSQAENLMNNDESVTAALKELSQNGASVIRGPVMIVPIKSTLVYAQTIYLSEPGEGPRMRGVLAFYDGRVSFGSNLTEALRQILSDGRHTDDYLSASQTSGIPDTEDELIDYSISVYQRVQEYQKAGDWENYGKAMKEFNDAMNRLADMRGERRAQNEFVGPVRGIDALQQD